MLKINRIDRTVTLLGYPMRLTPNEHRILFLLASEPDRIFSAVEILSLAFPAEKAVSKNQLAVHVSGINKKATVISGRPLIENPHKSGYRINPHL